MDKLNDLLKEYSQDITVGDLDSLKVLRGFIKWLVDNDKIDRYKELKENWLFRKYFYDLEYVKNYDRLVMWLSVEDEPIEFLTSILK